MSNSAQATFWLYTLHSRLYEGCQLDLSTSFPYKHYQGIGTDGPSIYYMTVTLTYTLSEFIFNQCYPFNLLSVYTQEGHNTVPQSVSVSL